MSRVTSSKHASRIFEVVAVVNVPRQAPCNSRKALTRWLQVDILLACCLLIARVSGVTLRCFGCCLHCIVTSVHVAPRFSEDIAHRIKVWVCFYVSWGRTCDAKPAPRTVHSSTYFHIIMCTRQHICFCQISPNTCKPNSQVDRYLESTPGFKSNLILYKHVHMCVCHVALVLLKTMLVVDQERRANIDDIATSPYFKLFVDPSLFAYYPQVSTHCELLRKRAGVFSASVVGRAVQRFET